MIGRLAAGRGVLALMLLALMLLGLSGQDAAADTPQQTSGAADPAQPQGTTLRSGWMPSAPYQMESPKSASGLAGIDIEILQEVARKAGFGVHLDRENWDTQIAYLRSGQIDVAAGAVVPESGDDRFLISAPYRQMRTAFYLPQGDQALYDLGDIPALLDANPTFRVGVIADRMFGDPVLNAAIDRAAQAGRIILAQDDRENFANLVEGRIDGFLGDRLSVTATAMNAGLKSVAHETVLPGSFPVRFLFSRQTVSADTVQRVDAAIATLQADGTLKQILHGHMFATVMGYALDSALLKTLDIIGTIAFAISGVVIAYRERFSLVGAMVLSALPAVGGGALRDLLVNRHPLDMLSSPLNLCLVGVTVLAGLGVIHLARHAQRHDWRITRHPLTANPALYRNLHEFTDALGMAVMTVSGVAVAVSMDARPLWLWGPILAMLTAAGGGMLRDIVRQSGSIASLRGAFYAEVPLIWAFLLSVFLMTRPTVFVPEHLGVAIICTVIGAFLTRICVLMLGLRSPAFGWRKW